MVSLSEMSVSPSERSVSRISKGEVGTIREIQPRGRGTHLLAQIVPLWLAGLVWTCLNTIDSRKWTLKVSSNVLHIRFQHTVVKLKMNHAMMNLTYCQTHPHLNPSGFFSGALYARAMSMSSRCLGTTPKEDWWENLGARGGSFIDHWTLGCMIECLSDKNSTIRVIVGFPFLIGYPLFIVDGLSFPKDPCMEYLPTLGLF